MSSAEAFFAEIRPGEMAVDAPLSPDAHIQFIGSIRTPWNSPRECPRCGELDGPVCRIEIFPPWDQALAGLARHTHLQVLYWMHLARRDLATQWPRHAKSAMGTFSLRSPNRPNPIASSLVEIVAIEGNLVSVRGLDCVDGTPLIDIKPEKCPHAVPRSEDGRVAS